MLRKSKERAKPQIDSPLRVAASACSLVFSRLFDHAPQLTKAVMVSAVAAGCATEMVPMAHARIEIKLQKAMRCKTPGTVPGTVRAGEGSCRREDLRMERVQPVNGCRKKTILRGDHRCAAAGRNEAWIATGDGLVTCLAPAHAPLRLSL